MIERYTLENIKRCLRNPDTWDGRSSEYCLTSNIVGLQ